MDPTTRRSLLGGIVASAFPGIAGCLGDGEAGGTDDDSDEVNSETDENDKSGDGTNPPDGKTAIAYADLTTRGQQFVDRTFSHHKVHWIFKQGTEREYVKLDGDAGKWVLDDEPLSIESVDEDIKEVYHGDALLEKDGQYYESVATVGQVPYRTKFIANEDASCEDTIDVTALSELQADVAAVLFEDGKALVAEEQYEPIADADVLWTDDRDDVTEFREMVVDGHCLTDGDRTVPLDNFDQDFKMDEGWGLEAIKTEND